MLHVFVLTSNHLSSSICYGYRRLVSKRRKPRWGNFLCKLSICVYIGLESGKFCHSPFSLLFVVLGQKAREWLRNLIAWLLPTRHWLSIVCTFHLCHMSLFLKYLIKYISLLVNFFRHPPTYTLGLLKLRRVVWSLSVSLSSCICIFYVCWFCNNM